MTKKVYMKPAMTVTNLDLNEHLLIGSVNSTGLGGNDISKGSGSGSSWDDAMSRRHGVLDEEEEQEEL